MMSDKLATHTVYTVHCPLCWINHSALSGAAADVIPIIPKFSGCKYGN